ncbi:kanamycin kinase [Sinosporangium album]|uniref:Kanamycin kinase n=2 Tax=Sinosporangium album TaxID=504805 RepID=A0A1G8GC91_9ACTN|nr:kanamycin kinase [Sinosporangium album]
MNRRLHSVMCPSQARAGGAARVPNTLLHADGAFAAHVDLDSLGVADRWADLAVAAWSTEWN